MFFMDEPNGIPICKELLIIQIQWKDKRTYNIIDHLHFRNCIHERSLCTAYPYPKSQEQTARNLEQIPKLIDLSNNSWFKTNFIFFLVPKRWKSKQLDYNLLYLRKVKSLVSSMYWPKVFPHNPSLLIILPKICKNKQKMKLIQITFDFITLFRLIQSEMNWFHFQLVWAIFIRKSDERKLVFCMYCFHYSNIIFMFLEENHWQTIKVWYCNWCLEFVHVQRHQRTIFPCRCSQGKADSNHLDYILEIHQYFISNASIYVDIGKWCIQ